MQDIVPFLIQHWALSLAFLIVLGLVIYEERKSTGNGGFALGPNAAVNLINREKAMVLDLRTAEQFQSGHIVNALNVPIADLEAKMPSLQKHQQSPVILICPMNKSATLVMAKFRKAGFTKAQLLAGGVEAWKKAELPLVKS